MGHLSKFHEASSLSIIDFGGALSCEGSRRTSQQRDSSARCCRVCMPITLLPPLSSCLCLEATNIKMEMTCLQVGAQVGISWCCMSNVHHSYSIESLSAITSYIYMQQSGYHSRSEALLFCSSRSACWPATHCQPEACLVVGLVVRRRRPSSVRVSKERLIDGQNRFHHGVCDDAARRRSVTLT